MCCLFSGEPYHKHALKYEFISIENNVDYILAAFDSTWLIKCWKIETKSLCLYVCVSEKFGLFFCLCLLSGYVCSSGSD